MSQNKILMNRRQLCRLFLSVPDKEVIHQESDKIAASQFAVGHESLQAGGFHIQVRAYLYKTLKHIFNILYRPRRSRTTGKERSINRSRQLRLWCHTNLAKCTTDQAVHERNTELDSQPRIDNRDELELCPSESDFDAY